MHGSDNGRGSKPAALSLLSSERPRNVSWLQAAGLLFGDWGTSRLYVLGLAFLFAGHSSFWLVVMMSLLILAVGWAYTQICRIYPDGGGVYTAAKNRSRMLAVIGALLLFADYTVTASLSVLDGFHYFGLHAHAVQVEYQDQGAQRASNSAAPASASAAPSQPSGQSSGPTDKAARASAEPHVKDAGDHIDPHPDEESSTREPLLAWDSPGLWAIIAIAVIGLFNLLGPKHSAGFAVFAAIGMVFITLLITFSALPKLDWHDLPHRTGSFAHDPKDMWVAFVSIVLALSGVEAIANLTGVMKKPVSVTAGRAIWVVALEVAIFNILLALCMVAIFPMDRAHHRDDMLAFLSGKFVGAWGEWAVRLVGGTLLISAGNTAVNGLMSILYVVSRDQELPAIFQRVNRFGAPWVAALVATGVPILVLVIIHDVGQLASLYAIGVIGAVSINVTLCAIHPRLRRLYRKIPMFLLGLVLLAIWITLATTKLHALIFVAAVMTVGLTARAITKRVQGRRERPSLLRQAIAEQLGDALARPKLLLGTYGSELLAPAALLEAKRDHAALVVCFIRQVALSYKYEGRRLNIDTDLAAVKTFSRLLDLGHSMGVPILPVYDTGDNAAELLAEAAAIHGCSKVLIGTSRKGALFHLIKGHFQRHLESLLPPDVHVEVISPEQAASASEEAEAEIEAERETEHKTEQRAE